MIQFFKFSGPLQLLALFLFAFLVRMPLFIFNPPMLIEELHIQVLLQKIFEGNFLYRDIFDNTPPLSAFFYTIIAFLFGKNIILFRVLATFLLFIQAILFKNLCNKNELLSEKGDVSALVYIAVSCIFFDLSTLSPALISTTFLLLALDRVFKHIKSENSDNQLFYVGFFVGISYLCYMPSFIYIILVIITFGLFTRTKMSQYILILVGFTFPILFVFTYFFIFNASQEFIKYYFLNFPFRNIIDADLQSILTLIGPLFLLIFVGIVRTFSFRRFINYQIVCAQLALLWFFISFIVLLFFLSKSTTGFITMLPMVAYFVTNFFMLSKRKLLNNFIFISVGIYYLTLLYSFFNKTEYTYFDYNFNNQYTTGSRWSVEFENRKILNLSDDFNVFIDNNCATGFVDFEISEQILSNVNNYKSISYISVQFKKDLPEIIIDDKNLMPIIFDKIPWLACKYIKDVRLNYYEKKSK